MSESIILTETLTGGRAAEEGLNLLKSQAAAQVVESTVGNPFTGPIRADISSGLLPVGPYRQDVDATFSLEFTLWLSEEILRIRRMTLHITPKPSRLAAGSSEASADTVNVESAGHVHIWLSKIGAAVVTGTNVHAGATTAGPSATVFVGDSVHVHTETGVNTLGPSSTVAVGTSTHTHVPSSTVSVPIVGNFSNFGSFDSTGTADSNRAFDLIPKSGTPTDYYTAISGNTPTAVSTPDHTHPVVLAISESGMANNIAILIDGVDRTALLGGPWTAAATVILDPAKLITCGFMDVKQTPSAGAHVVKLTSSASGAIEIVGDYSVIIKAVE
jgi:hypothetical protein